MAQLFGIPLIVENFVKKLKDIESKYVFAVCTCGGMESVNALPTLKNLAKMIKSVGGRLAAEFSIHLPMNNLKYPSPLVEQNQEKMFRECEDKINVISRYVSERKESDQKTLKYLFDLSMRPLYMLLRGMYVTHLKKMSKEPEDTDMKYREMIPLSDKSIYSDDKCNGCGICAKVCPVNNIKMVKKKPVWLHHCEMCMACAEWCPRKAVHHWNRKEGIYYRHPGVNLSDMISSKTL